MTVIRLGDGRLLLYSSCRIDAADREAIEGMGPVSAIVAPGNFHHQHVAACQEAFPDASTYACPGAELKQPRLQNGWFLGDHPASEWENELDQAQDAGRNP